MAKQKQTKRVLVCDLKRGDTLLALNGEDMAGGKITKITDEHSYIYIDYRDRSGAMAYTFAKSYDKATVELVSELGGITGDRAYRQARALAGVR